MFNVTLVNLARDARSAAAGLGATKLERIPASEFAALLESFRGLDPLQNTADPEIRVVTSQGSFLIRTERGKLFLYDARDRTAPAHELPVSEIIAELDGTAAAARTALPFALYAAAEARAPGQGSASGIAASPARRPPVIRLAICLVLLMAVIALRYWPGRLAVHPPLDTVGSVEQAGLRDSLTGVYMTGSQPGDHGIVVLDNGGLKIFQLNAQTAPSVIYDTYALGRLGAKLCLVTNQPGGLIEVNGRDTLLYCGETYQRIP